MNESNMQCVICGLQMIQIPRENIPEGFDHYECPNHDNVMSTFKDELVELQK